MTKPYTWQEIKNFLQQELKKTKHILTFGTIGSCNIESDIDAIITKKPTSKTSDFYKEIHNLFDSLDKHLKKYNGKVIRFPIEKNLTLLAAHSEKNDLAFHAMFYTNYPQIERDWGWFLFDDENVKDIISKSSFLLGSFKELLSKEFQRPSYYDSAYIILYWFDMINSNIPEKHLIKIMNENFESIIKKKLKFDSVPKAKNKKEIRKVFYGVCDTLDELNVNKAK